MMSKVLVVGSYDQVSSLIHRSAETLEVRNYIQPETDEAKALDGQLELVTGLTVYSFNQDQGKLRVLQVQVKSLDEKGEELGDGSTYCTFGGTLDSDDQIVEGVTSDEEGNVNYNLTFDQFVDLIPAVAKRAAERELGVTIEKQITPENVVVFQTNKVEGQIGKLVMSGLLLVTDEEMDALEAVKDFNKEVINRVGSVGVDVGMMLTSFDISNVLENTIQTLIHQHGIDPLSATNIKLCTQGSINQVLSQVSYANIRDAVKLREAADQLEKDLAAEQDKGIEDQPQA